MENLNSLAKNEFSEEVCSNIKDKNENSFILPNSCSKDTINTIIYAKEELSKTSGIKQPKILVKSEDEKKDQLVDPKLQLGCFTNNNIDQDENNNENSTVLNSLTNNLFRVNYNSLFKTNPDIVIESKSNNNPINNINNDGFASYVDSVDKLYSNYSNNQMLNNPPISKYLLNKFTQNKEFYNTGRWTQNEHFRFIKGCLLFGNNWKKVSTKNNK